MGRRAVLGAPAHLSQRGSKSRGQAVDRGEEPLRAIRKALGVRQRPQRGITQRALPMFESSEGQQLPDQDHGGQSTQPTGGIPTPAGPAGNRPADGAPVLRPDELPTEDWGAGEDSQDFLGLNEASGDVTPAAEADTDPALEPTSEVGAALADAPELEDGAFESWLEDDDEDSASWLMELEDEPGEDAFDPERLEAEFGIETAPSAPSRGGWLVRMTLVAAGLGAGFVGARWYGARNADTTADTPIAHVQQPATPNNATPTNATDGTTGAANATGDNATGENGATGQQNTTDTTGQTGDNATTGQPTATTNTNTTNPQGGTANPVAPAANGQTDSTGTTHPTEPGPGIGVSSTPTEINPAPTTPTGTTEGHQFTMPVEDMVILPTVDSPVRYAQPEDLAAIWMGTEIPVAKIEGETRILTPQVGRVRLVIHGGEIFEGRLYAVGENKVWLDTGLGKMALLGWQVDHMEHIAPGDSPTLGQTGSQDLAGLERVRVRTPGGVFYGKLLDQSNGTVTLITEQGGRIRLSNARVEPAGRSRTRIVDPGSAAPKEAASTRD